MQKVQKGEKKAILVRTTRQR